MKDTPTPDSLRPGNVVGPWRIEGYAGNGTYGVVYRARRASHPGSPPVALKLAVFAQDPRFAREAELLSRLQHPAVPKLLFRGWWTAGPDAAHPYLVMEWIRGLPLYEWGREYNATSRQVLQVLAQVAGALAALHRSGCLHRDVKGGNILVDADGRAVLMDYGSSTWAGAPPLTESLMPPNTREYRSPEALRFEWGNWRDKAARYQACPADDLYALGVGMYRLVTQAYPPPGTEPEEVKERLQAPASRRLPVQVLNGRVVPELSALIERLLAEEPEARGLASEVAKEASAAAKRAGPEADVPLFGSERRKARAEAVHVRTALLPTRFRILRPWLIAGLLILGMAGLWWAGLAVRQEMPVLAQAEVPDAVMAPDAGTRGLGDDALTEGGATQDAPLTAEAISLDIPKQPLPGQRRPPCLRGERVIQGACWRRLAEIEPPCSQARAYEWQGACYDPALKPTRSPTSENPQ